ncbi:META domain-containing protein [Methanoregula sp. PtaB.Bin085]|uniref:META domain-containing protein n=1 Tax=Methanoregula sp. PtaB.Bin085 TaxID=1811680 RepID=UPI0009D31CBB|nr:META domain-containing protein [Methanoregula sp. PtaB.Bin085]OPX64613.1 MAG: META domain protein [Methanoregula sp. PtaB.Bin085]
MTDDLPAGADDAVSGDEENIPAGQTETMGYGFYAALGLIGILVLLILSHPLVLPVDSGLEMTKTNWTLLSYADAGGTLVPVINGSEMTARFDTREGRMSGRSGCNGYSALYTTKSNAITLSREIITDMRCDRPGIMEQESVFLADLSKVSSFRVSGSTLKMYDETGTTVFVFIASSAIRD